MLGHLLGGADDAVARAAALVALVVPPPSSYPSSSSENAEDPPDTVGAQMASLGSFRTLSRVAPLELERMMESRLDRPGKRADSPTKHAAAEFRKARPVVRDVSRMLQGLLKM